MVDPLPALELEMLNTKSPKANVESLSADDICKKAAALLFGNDGLDWCFLYFPRDM